VALLEEPGVELILQLLDKSMRHFLALVGASCGQEVILLGNFLKFYSCGDQIKRKK